MRAWIAVLALVMALPAQAVNDWAYPGCNESNQIGDSGKICFDFDS